MRGAALRAHALEDFGRLWVWAWRIHCRRLARSNAHGEYHAHHRSSTDDAWRSFGLSKLVERHLELRHQAVPFGCAFRRRSITRCGDADDANHPHLRLERVD